MERAECPERAERAEVDDVRLFNRTVTERIGVLEDHYLSRSRPLSQSRLLWEIGPAGAAIRELRKRLALDSGYLSRQLRSLETEGLVEFFADPADARVRIARLTNAGQAELGELNRLSDRLVRDILAPLSGEQRERLVSAMVEVQRLLTASAVRIRPADPREPDARSCIASYFDELARRFPSGFDPRQTRPATDEQFTEPAGVLLVAYLRGSAVGCVGLVTHGLQAAEIGAIAEIKRLWVSAAARGLGLGRRLLSEAEDQARSRGVTVLRLDTNPTLTEAIQLYRTSGYQEIPPYNDEPYAGHWFEKRLDGPAC
jgi:DNA-binding MarR family transcriptional regulator/ribosomal protein S18 acetylase RimI-like enzyme